MLVHILFTCVQILMKKKFFALASTTITLANDIGKERKVNFLLMRATTKVDGHVNVLSEQINGPSALSRQAMMYLLTRG